MGKSKESKAVNKNATSQYNQLQGQTQSNQQNEAAAQARAASTYNSALAGIGDFQSQLPGLSANYSGFMGPTGGLDAGLVSGLKSNIGEYQNFAHGNTEAGKLYSNLIKTGGYTPEEIELIRLQGSKIPTAFYDNLKNQLAQSNAAQGGYSPGYSGGLAKLARESAHAGQEGAINSELGMQGDIRSGKLAGATGQNQMFLSGMGGASQLGLGLADAQRQGQEFGAQGMQNVASQGLQGVNALQNLYASTPGEVSMYNQNQNALNSATGSNIGQRMQYNPNQSFFDKYGMPIINAAAGGLSGLGGGLVKKGVGALGGNRGQGEYMGGWS